MKAVHFRRALEDLDMTQAEAAELLGLGPRTMNGYASGERAIPKTVGIIINLLVGGAITVDQIDAVQ
jgi:transcriptional regulator with XRE-family HTH domain